MYITIQWNWPMVICPTGVLNYPRHSKWLAHCLPINEWTLSVASINSFVPRTWIFTWTLISPTSLPNGQFWEHAMPTMHYSDKMSTMASQFTSLTTIYSTVYLGVDQRKHQSSASLALVREIRWRPVNSPGPVTQKIFPFDGVIMGYVYYIWEPIPRLRYSIEKSIKFLKTIYYSVKFPIVLEP